MYLKHTYSLASFPGNLMCAHAHTCTTITWNASLIAEPHLYRPAAEAIFPEAFQLWSMNHTNSVGPRVLHVIEVANIPRNRHAKELYIYLHSSPASKPALNYLFPSIDPKSVQ